MEGRRRRGDNRGELSLLRFRYRFFGACSFRHWSGQNLFRNRSYYSLEAGTAQICYIRYHIHYRKIAFLRPIAAVMNVALLLCSYLNLFCTIFRQSPIPRSLLSIFICLRMVTVYYNAFFFTEQRGWNRFKKLWGW